MEKKYAQIAGESYNNFCEKCSEAGLSEDEFKEALKVFKNWVNFEAEEWGV